MCSNAKNPAKENPGGINQANSVIKPTPSTHHAIGINGSAAAQAE
jgi:hypothetical protein